MPTSDTNSVTVVQLMETTLLNLVNYARYASNSHMTLSNNNLIWLAVSCLVILT